VTVDLMVRAARLDDAGPVQDIAIVGSRIVDVGPDLTVDARRVVDAAGDLVLPGFVCAHLHLDKTGLDPTLRPPTWHGNKRELRALNAKVRREATFDSILERATAAIESALRHGTTVVRAFADVEPETGLTGVKALVALRELYAGQVRIEVCGSPQALIGGSATTERLLEEAIEAGADVVGAMPTEEPTEHLLRRHVDHCFDIARRHDRDVHLLIDDTDDPSDRALEYAAWRTIESGWEGRVTASHAGALSAYDEAHAAKVVRRVADAGISVCVNAHVSLVLQGWHDRGPIRRGATRVAELRAAGVNVLAAQDDLDDPYYSLGRGDPLEVAAYAAHVCHLMWPAELETVRDFVTVNAARALRLPDYGIRPGSQADLVVSGRSTLRAALADLPPRPAVIAAGRVVVETTTQTLRSGEPDRSTSRTDQPPV
jgi:cytosine deaminase